MEVRYKNEEIEFAGRMLNQRQDISDQEAQEWLQNEDNVRLLDELAGIKQKIEPQSFAVSKTEVYSRLRKQMLREKRTKILRLAAVAASVVILIGSVFIYHLNSPDAVQPIKGLQETSIQPGSVKAELILDDGQTIGLNRENKLISLAEAGEIHNDSLQGLDYSDAKIESGIAKLSFNTLKVPVGGFYMLTLEDGTKVWLNAASELRYPVYFGQAERNVYLYGEAYFEVNHRENQPFIVHMKDSRIAVLGTKFNVSAYEDEKDIYATLAEGSIRFYSEKSGQKLLLHPGTQSKMNRNTGETELKKVDIYPYMAWVDGYFVFREMDLETIMRQLQRWYGFQVFYQNPEVKHFKFRGMIDRNMSINKVLQIIEQTTDVKFRTDGKTVMVSKR